VLIRIHVTPDAKEAQLVKVGENSFEVKVDERAIAGRANKRLVEILSDHFALPKSRILIVKGVKSRDKIVQVILDSPADRDSGNP
jgi:uncharacterized protein